MRHSHKRLERRGTVIVLMAIMMVIMFALLAFAVDIGYVMLIRTQLQTSADSAAMAGTWELLDSRFITPSATYQVTKQEAINHAGFYAGDNYVGGTSPGLATNDVTIGRLDLSNGAFTDESNYLDKDRLNAVQVRVQRTGDQNGEVPLFFARVLGVNTAPNNAVAMAAYCDNFQGFNPPAVGERNLAILPFTLDEYTWNELLNGQTDDHWTWDAPNERAIPNRPDGIHEANLYPQDTGSPGNRGTVDIGRASNSTRDLSDQIRKGVTADDLSRLPGDVLEPGSDGKITLGADTGMSNGIKDDLQWLVDQAHVRQAAPTPDPTNLRVIPIFQSVDGNGNNAKYKIVGFAGVRILAVNLTGNPSDRYVIVQPDKMVIDRGIPASDSTPFSQYIYSKHVWLVR